MLALKGVPGIYYHSLLGSRNWIAGMLETGHNRTINREKLDVDVLYEELQVKGSLRQTVFNGFQIMLNIRNREQAFDPFGQQKVMDHNESIFGVFRYQKDRTDGIYCLSNLSDQPQTMKFYVDEYCASQSAALVDQISGDHYLIIEEECEVVLRPYQVCWLKLSKGMDNSNA
jgi:sucrose phosphorylase